MRLYLPSSIERGEVNQGMIIEDIKKLNPLI
jgi:hypothetical protein